MVFGIYSLIRGPHDSEILDDTRLIEDSAYISTNKLVEKMLMSGQVPRVPDELYDEEENINDPQIPDDADLREPDSDFTDLDRVAGKLQFRVESSGSGGSSSSGDSVEGSDQPGNVEVPDSSEE